MVMALVLLLVLCLLLLAAAAAEPSMWLGATVQVVVVVGAIRGVLLLVAQVALGRMVVRGERLQQPMWVQEAAAAALLGQEEAAELGWTEHLQAMVGRVRQTATLALQLFMALVAEVAGTSTLVVVVEPTPVMVPALVASRLRELRIMVGVVGAAAITGIASGMAGLVWP